MVEPQAFKDKERLAWNLCADKYDVYLTEPFRPFAEKLLSLVSLERGQRVLDVATGSGLVASIAAPVVGAGGEVVGVDLSPRMVQRADRRAQEKKVQNVRFLPMDAEILDFPNGSFDVVLCALGLMLFPQPGKALSEMHRVLKLGGTAGLSNARTTRTSNSTVRIWPINRLAADRP